jgi:hypothetical protein
MKPICWVLQEDGVWPVEAVAFTLFNTARVVLVGGEVRVTDRGNLLDPDDLDKKFDYKAWLLEMP